MNEPELVARVQRYCQRQGLTFGEKLGSGVQGIVFSAESQAQGGRVAVKVHDREEAYLRERNVYLRLKQGGVMAIRDCTVPQLLGHDDELWIIEMTVVTPPFVLDFGGAHLDQPPDFSAEILEEWRLEKQEQFESRWPEVEAIIRFLQGYGVFLEDVNPKNIVFRK